MKEQSEREEEACACGRLPDLTFSQGSKGDMVIGIHANQECLLGSRQDKDTRPPEQRQETGKAALFPNYLNLHSPLKILLEGM